MTGDALNNGGLSITSTLGLLIFVAVFLGIIAWTLTRSRRQVKHWSELPLSDDSDDSNPTDEPKSSEKSNP